MTTKEGTIVTMPGIIIEERNTLNSALCPLNRSFAKAYPASVQNRMFENMPTNVRIDVFTSATTKAFALYAFVYVKTYL